MRLSSRDHDMLDGGHGAATAMAMRIVVRMADLHQSSHLIDVTRAHIDGCLYHGPAGLDLAERLADLGARVVIPTTLNVSSLDLLHPELYRGDPEEGRLARRLMETYVAMGCAPTWTCAPYQLPDRPAFGEQIAWAESNAIVFANSVLGARTNRYGDFIDICAAITGRVPATGLHLDDGRRAELVVDVGELPPSMLGSDLIFPTLGHLIGKMAGARVVAVVGLPGASEDQLKALGAAAGASGAVALIHVVGITPEAPTLEAALGGASNAETVAVTATDLRRSRSELTTTRGKALTAVSLGTPHASSTEMARYAQLLEGRRIHPAIELYVSTGRHVLGDADDSGVAARLRHAGVTLVVDTCTYITPVMRRSGGIVMTDSAKWAFYAPGNIGVEVILGSTEECIASAVAGRPVIPEDVWDG